MIFITAKFLVQPQHADDWPSVADAFTQATRAEPGCLWFEWSRSIEQADEYVLVEAFRDDAAAGAHVQSAHFFEAQRTLPAYLVATPKIVNATIPQDDWSLLGELTVPTD